MIMNSPDIPVNMRNTSQMVNFETRQICIN